MRKHKLFNGLVHLRISRFQVQLLMGAPLQNSNGFNVILMFSGL